MDLNDKLTTLLYLGKVTTFHQCPKKYYWTHHLHLHPKVKPTNLSFGSFVHKMFLEVGIGQSFQISEALLQDRADLAATLGWKPDQKVIELLQTTSKADKDLCLNMLDVFSPVWQAKKRTVLGIEKTVQFPINHLSDLFTNWCVKADVTFEDDEGLWVGDLKTTAAYGASIAKYYHSSPQTKAYFWVLKQLMPNLRGTKIFVVTKQKIRCEVETILLTEQDQYEAELFVTESVKEITELEHIAGDCRIHEDCSVMEYDPDSYSRRMTQCINHFGQECPYMPICIQPIKSQEYLDDLLANWYKIENPDDHLEL